MTLLRRRRKREVETIKAGDVGTIDASALVPEKRVVAAVGAAVGHGGQTDTGEKGKALQAVMVQAIEDIMATGEQDPDKIRKAQLDARQKWLDEH